MDDRGGAAAVSLLNVARWRSCLMFDSQCDLAALVYEQDQNPNPSKILHDFAVCEVFEQATGGPIS
jgi:hypothetical protein